MHRYILSSTLMLSLACGQGDPSATETAEDTSATTTGTSSVDDVCHPGYESCPCTDDGLCLMGLACISAVCVEAPPGWSSSSTTEPAESSESTIALDDGSSSSSSSGETSSSSSSEGESSTTSFFPACEVSARHCETGTTTLYTCVQGDWFPLDDCIEFCTEQGWTTGTCDPELEQGCACEGFGDPVCETAAEAYCSCLPELGGGACDDTDLSNAYFNCVDEDWPEVACFGSFFVDGSIDCDAAYAGCF